MKKLLIFFIFIFILSTYSTSFGENMDIRGEAAILVDFDTLEVLYEKNSNQKLYPASTTKIMTGILAIENGNLNDLITIDEEVVKLTYGSHIALEAGEILTLKQLLDALLIESANDAAFAIAKYVSGNIKDFSKLMNEKAKYIGAVNTKFINPNGLPDENHVTTAYDLALIANYAMKNPIFKDIVKNHTGIIPTTNKKTEERYLKSANQLLYSNKKILLDGKYIPVKYEGVNGVKSGYTSDAGYCLVTSLEKDGYNFLAVVLNSDKENIHIDTHKLFNYGLNNFNKINVCFANKFIDNFNVKNGVLPFATGVTKSDSYCIVNYKNMDKIVESISFDKNLEAPIKKGQKIGSVRYLLEDKVIAEADIVSTMSIEKVPIPGFLSKIISKWYIGVFIALIMLRISILKKKKKRRKLKQKRTSLYKI